MKKAPYFLVQKNTTQMCMTAIVIREYVYICPSVEQWHCQALNYQSTIMQYQPV